MAITVKHQFVSAKGDGSDATLVRPSNWNASHDINLATNAIIGRLTAGPGLAEELPVTAYMIGLLNTANFAALAAALGLPTTGDAKLTFKQAATPGWVIADDGTIGDVGSGATRTGSDTAALFTFFYDTMYEGFVPLLTSVGAPTTRTAQGTAASAFTAKCRMVLPKTLGRVLIPGGPNAGAGLTQHWPGEVGGLETHTLTLSEMVAHSHTQQGTFGGSGSGSGSISGSGSGSCSGTTGAADRSLDHLHNLGGSTGAMDRGNPHHHDYSVVNNSQTKPQSGGLAAYIDTRAASTTDTDINHLHGLPGTTGAMDRAIDHLHAFSGSASVSVGGSCSVSVNVNTVISGQTGTQGSSTPFSIMQPWVGITVMIKL
jgi:hypothetical protein